MDSAQPSHRSIIHVLWEVFATLAAGALLLDLLGLVDLGWNQPVKRSVEGALHVEKVWSGGTALFLWALAKILKLTEAGTLLGLFARWAIVAGRHLQRRTVVVLRVLRRLAPWGLVATTLFGGLSYALQSPFTPSWVPADPAKMAHLAMTSDYELVRMAAVRKINDQSWLAEVAIGSYWTDSSSAALDQLTDQWMIYKVITDEGIRGGGSGAVKKLTDQRLLEKLATTSYDGTVRAQAAERIADHSLLERIASRDKDANVRLAAAKKLGDQRLLATIALLASEGSFEARDAAAQLITEPNLLTTFAQEGGWETQRIAADRLIDQNVLAILANKKSADEFARVTATKKLTDQPVLTRLATTSDSVPVREAATRKLINKELLVKIALKHRDGYPYDFDDRVQIAAVETLSDQSLLTRIASGAGDIEVRKAAVTKLTDQSLLAKIAMEDEDHEIRRAALENLGDQALLVRVARETNDGDLWRAAVRKISDSSLGKQITASKDGDAYVIPAFKRGKPYRTVSVGECRELGGTVKLTQYNGMSTPTECVVN